MKLRSLRALTLVFLCVFVTATLGTAFALYTSTTAAIDRLVMQRLVVISEAVAPAGTRLQVPELDSRIRRVLEKREFGNIGFVLTRHGKVEFANIPLTRPLPEGIERLRSSDGIAGLSYGLALTRSLPNDLRLSVVAQTEPVPHYRAVRLRIYLAGFGSITVLAIAATLIFGLTIERRMSAMQRTVDAIIAGDLSSRVPTDGSGSEFDRQAASFNNMLDRIDELVQEIHNVSNDIAHELRTPLARLRNELSLLASEPSPNNLRIGIGEAMEQTDAVLSTFSSLLRLSEIESGEKRRDFSTTNVMDLAAHCVSDFEPVAHDQGKSLLLMPSTTALVAGDQQLLTQLIINLIENALRHTPPGTVTRVWTRCEQDAAILTVSDDGHGLPEEARSTVIARFRRLRSDDSSGYGIGLSLVDSIARLHGGTLSLEDAEPGVRAVVRLPLLGQRG